MAPQTPVREITIGILTALPVEHAAARAVLAGGDTSTPRGDPNAASRQVIVERLPAAIKYSVRRHQSAKLDVHEILDTCYDYDGGVQELVDAIRSVAGDSLSLGAAAAALGVR